MTSPPVLDLEELLGPIPGENPSGKSLVYEPEYDLLKEARRAEDDTLQGDWQRKSKVAEWDRVIELAEEILRKKSKDLQVAAWMAEAAARLHGFAGLRDGFRLIKGLLDRFWETCYPEIDDGDLEARAAPLGFLNHERLLPMLLRGLPLTDDAGEHRYSFFRWQESRATDNAGLKDPDHMQVLINEGKIVSKQFDDAVAQTPRSYYERLVGDLEECQAALKELDRCADERFGREAPSLVNVRKALEDCQKLLVPILKTKRELEPDESIPAEEAETAEDGQDQDEGPPEEDGGDVETRVAPPRRRAGATGPIADAPDAYRRILDAAAYLRQNDRGSPVPYLVVRALRMAEVFGMPRPLDSSSLPSPPSTSRQSLKLLAAEGRWEDVLEEAEQALGRPEGRAWLDAHRHALRAMAETEGLSAAADAARALLRAFLAEFPEIVRAELADDTPAANAETRAWLESEILPQFEAEPAPTPPPPPAMPDYPDERDGSEEDEEAEPDAWDRALELVDRGRLSDGLQVVRRAMAAADTGREKFRRKFQMAELCLRAESPRVALPLLEELARQVDEFHLEQWEDEQWIARVWSAYYRCLKVAGGSDPAMADRLRQAYTRLCRLDVNHALIFGEDGGR